MESYGSYQTSREIGSGANSIVYLATKSGDATSQFAVKLVFPSAPVDDPLSSGGTRLRQEAEAAFLNSVELQKKAASSSYIAPILESGTDERGSWCVTRFYPRSIQRIIAGRVALNHAGILHILRGVVGGLLDLKRLCGRSHGRLHAGNVLIGGGATLSEAQVHLTDCAPDGIDAARCELADLRSVGLLLFQLIRKREVGDKDDWLILPLEASKEWTDAFGRSTSAWLTIGNTLLDRDLSLERYSLERLAQDLAALEPKPPVSRRTVVAVALGLVLAVAGVLVFVLLGNWITVPVVIVGPGGIRGPDDFQLTLNGQPASTKTSAGTSRQLRLRKNQPYEIAVSYGDLGSFKTNVSFPAAPQQALELPLVFGSLIVIGGPAGAEFVLTNGSTTVDTKSASGNYTNAFAKPGSWSLTVKRDGFLSFSSSTELEAGATKVLSATLKARDPDAVVVDIDSSPKGARVLVVDARGVTVETNITGEGASQLKPGKYQLVASFPFWDRPQQQVVTTNVEAGRELAVRFHFPSARIQVVCEDPPEAVVTVSNRYSPEIRATNFTTPVHLTAWPTGTYDFQFTAPGYVRTNRTVTLLESTSKTTTEISARLTPLLGFVALTSTLPAVIRIVETGEVVATNDAVVPTVFGRKPGKYTLEATPQDLPGFPKQTKEVELKKGETQPLLFQFDYGVVTVSSDPPGAEVEDPARQRWVPAALVSYLPLGITRLTARYPKYHFEDESVPVTLTNRQRTPVTFEFKYGTVIVTSLPSAAKIFVNEQPIGTTPMTISNVPFGEVSYQLQAEGRKRPVKVKVAARTTYVLGRNLSVPDSYTNSFEMEFEYVPAAGIYVGRFEVTEGVFQKVTGISSGATDLDLPKNSITYAGAEEFRDKLNSQDASFLKANLVDGELYEYAIPNDAEWRAYATPALLNEDTDAIFLKQGGNSKREPVHRRPREVETSGRLFDVFGNVAEWCELAAGKHSIRGGSYGTLKSGAAKVQKQYEDVDGDQPDPTKWRNDRGVGLRMVLRRKRGG